MQSLPFATVGLAFVRPDLYTEGVPRLVTPARPAVESRRGCAPTAPRILTPVILGAVYFLCVNSANAATIPAFSACSGSSDIPVCERLDYIAGQSAIIDDIYRAVGWSLGLLLVLIFLPIFMRVFSRSGAGS